MKITDEYLIKSISVDKSLSLPELTIVMIPTKYERRNSRILRFVTGLFHSQKPVKVKLVIKKGKEE